MTHARESKVPEWVHSLSQPPPGAFDSSAITWGKHMAGKRGQQQHETSCAVILADRLHDYIDGAPCTALRATNMSLWGHCALRACLLVWLQQSGAC